MSQINLKILESIQTTILFIKEFDASSTGLNSFMYSNSNVNRLNLSFNNFVILFENFFYINTLLNYPYLTILDLTKSLSSQLSNRVFFFNKFLEEAYLSQNFLEFFPTFCQFCFSIYCKENKEINFKCKLRVLDLSSNNLQKISFKDLIELNNLEYLNLENNLIAEIGFRVFYNMGRLKHLILSLNRLTHLNSSLFYDLSNLKLVNLSWNRIELIPKDLFKVLFKLETIDLSFNRIYFIENFSFSKLTYLRNLYLNENDEKIFIDSMSFFELDSIQNIYISKFALNSNLTKSILIKLFEDKNKKFFKKVLKRSYYKSLFVITDYTNNSYDCLMSLFFIEKNVHFNFKLEKHFVDSRSQCLGLTIKKSLISLDSLSPRYDANITLALFLCLYILFLIILILYFLFSSENYEKDQEISLPFISQSISKWTFATKIISYGHVIKKLKKKNPSRN